LYSDSTIDGARSGFTPLLAEIGKLRARAWGATPNSNYFEWLDEWDASAHHHVIMRDGELAAAFRFTLHDRLEDLPHRALYGELLDHLPAPIAWFSRLVVAPERRGQGLSRSLDFLGANEPFDFGARSIVATGGSVRANQFRHRVMQRLGWAYLGKAVDAIDLPIEGANPPAVYARQSPRT